MTLDSGNYGIFLIMGNAGFISSTDATGTFRSLRKCRAAEIPGVPWTMSYFSGIL